MYNPYLTVFVKFLDPTANLPEKKSFEAAAFDLYALEDTTLIPFEVNKVRTGIAIEVPKGYKGEVYTRSGYGAKGIFVVNQPGKIDSDYRGEIFVTLLYIPQNFAHVFNSAIQSMRTFARTGGGYGSAIKMVDELKTLQLPTYEIKAKDRIAQFEIQTVEETELKLAVELSDTERGSKGFGSSGT